MSRQYLQTHTLPSAHPTDIFALATTPTQLLSASGSSSIRVHSTRGRVIHADTPDDEHPYALTQTLEKAHPLGCHHICTSDSSADSTTPVLAASAGFGGEVKLWEFDSDASEWRARGELVSEDPKRRGQVWAVALSVDGRALATTTPDGRIEVFDTTTVTSDRQPTANIARYETKGSFALCVDISPYITSAGGSLTASGHQNGGVYIFHNSTQRLAHSLTGLVRPVRAVKFSPAGTYLAAAGDARVIALYATTSGEQVASLTGHAAWIMSLDWSPRTGEFLLSGAHDGKAKVWSVERRECVATQTESDKCLWAVKWLPPLPAPAPPASATFVTAAAGGTLAFYREASGT